MEDTYTYIARNAQDLSRVVTLTLHDHLMSVGSGPPLEQIERAMPEAQAESPETDIAKPTARPKLWLRPLALSLLQRGTRPFPVADVSARLDEQNLNVHAWLRAGGLRLLPVTLIDGRVDNPEAALAFVDELETRKAGAAPFIGLLEVLDYWATWAAALLALVGVFQLWRRQRSQS